MKKDLLLLGMTSLLSIGVIMGVFNWLDGSGMISSEAALRQARQWLAVSCARKGIPAASMKLVEVFAPDAHSNHWRFQFQSPATGAVLVEVAGHHDGDTLFHSR